MSCDLEVTNENGAGKYLDSWKTNLTSLECQLLVIHG